MRTIPEINLDSLTLYKQIENAKQGDEFTYAMLSESIGRNVQKEARGNLKTAIAMVLREKGLVFDTIRNVGTKCLNDDEIPGIALGVIKHVRKITLRTAKKIVCVKNFDSLPVDKKIQHNTMLTIMIFMSKTAKQKRIKQIEDKVAQTQRILPLNKTLEAFKKNGNEEVRPDETG